MKEGRVISLLALAAGAAGLEYGPSRLACWFGGCSVDSDVETVGISVSWRLRQDTDAHRISPYFAS